MIKVDRKNETINAFDVDEVFHNPALPLTASVIIPAHNSETLLRSCLTHLKKTEGCQYEVIVVDDGSVDGTARIAEEMGARVLRLGRKRGPAVARNRGSGFARGEILVFIDSDVFVTPDTLGFLVDTLRQAPEYDAVIGSYDIQPTAQNLVSQYKNLLHHYTHQVANREACTFWTGCGAVRSKRFFQLGGFDESFEQPSIEDIEFGSRLKESGSRIRLVPSIQVTHAKCWRLVSLVKTDFFARALPWTQLILKHGSMPNDLNLKFTQRLCVIAVALLSMWMVLALRWEPYIMALVLVSLLLVVIIDRIEETRWNRNGSRFAAFVLIVGFLSIGSFAPISTLAIATTLFLVGSLNLGMFRFFAKQRGLVFATLCVPLHLTYYLYSGVGFLIGCIKHLQDQFFGNPKEIAPDRLGRTPVMDIAGFNPTRQSSISLGTDRTLKMKESKL